MAHPSVNWTMTRENNTTIETILIIMEDYKRYSEMLEELIAHIDLKDELKAVANSNINLARVQCGIGFTATDYKELKKISKHYDIANFKPFDKVLVRDRNDEPWRIAFYGYYNEEANYSHFVGTCWSKQCIPFNDDTKHLLGTTDMPSEEYINW